MEIENVSRKSGSELVSEILRNLPKERSAAESSVRMARSIHGCVRDSCDECPHSCDCDFPQFLPY